MSIRGRKGVQVRQTVQRRIEGTVGICVLSKIPSCVHAMGDLVFGHNFKLHIELFYHCMYTGGVSSPTVRSHTSL